MENYFWDNGLLLHIHHAMNTDIDWQTNHGIHFRLLAEALCLSGGDHVYSNTVVGKFKTVSSKVKWTTL